MQTQNQFKFSVLLLFLKYPLQALPASATAIAAGIRVARIVSDSDCFYSVTGTATTSSSYLPANAIEYVHVFTGDTVSVILASGTGSAYITSMV